jgi:hypothetical protein
LAFKRAIAESNVSFTIQHGNTKEAVGRSEFSKPKPISLSRRFSHRSFRTDRFYLAEIGMQCRPFRGNSFLWLRNDFLLALLGL